MVYPISAYTNLQTIQTLPEGHCSSSFTSSKHLNTKAMGTYPIDKTALVLVDPFNDFLSEGGKLYPVTKSTVEGVGLIANLKKLLLAARSKQVQVIYAPHH